VVVARSATRRWSGKVSASSWARELTLAERTVKAHVSNLLAKLAVSSRTQAALLARDLP
jgi:DNA-binding NarL/FixJ family response regulator